MQANIKTFSDFQSLSINKKETAQQLHQLRIKNGFTIEQISEYCSCSERTVSFWEEGKRFPSVERLLLLEYLYNLECLDQLIRVS